MRSRGKNSYPGLVEDKHDYSTELSRSAQLFPLHAIFNKNGERIIGDCEIQARGRTKRDDGPRAPMSKWLLANAMVYGLINVRTDGRKIVMGVLKEGESSFQVEEFTP